MGGDGDRPVAPGSTRGLGLEVLLVLGVSLGADALRSILRIIDRMTRAEPLASQSTQMNSSVAADRPWLDLAFQLTWIVTSLVPVALVMYLLWVRPALPETVGNAGDGPVSANSRGLGNGLGFDLARPASDLLRGFLLAFAIGVPGLGFYLMARELGVNTTVEPGNLAENWWTIPVYMLAAAMNGIVEEVIMLGYLFLRLRQIGWTWWAIVVASALIRGSYHLYQGFGGFAGNVIMGIVFGLLFLRWRRSGPFVAAHTFIDIAAFIGYAMLAGRVDWL